MGSCLQGSDCVAATVAVAVPRPERLVEPSMREAVRLLHYRRFACAHRTISAAPIAPACRAISRPPLNSARVGMLRML